MIVRNLLPNDLIPKHGLEPLVLDNEWVWVAEKDGQIVGLLIAAPCHHSVFLIRLVAAHNAPHTWVRSILRGVAKDCLRRGYFVAFTYFNLEDGTEARLAKLLWRRGKEGRKSIVASRYAMSVCAVEDWCNG